ncbi:alpha/beta hydrolase family protein [Gordonia hankookensis]|uniref:Alpha/beta hydrolase n=1 Tax=Gordonia hankookensis TaxID=589403 RepID=A0ABR7WC92_9ACTN|nr:lipase family protein [Gordonia hankookensis]MBD1320419.1 alpha/beta hydrolase [Gordonia hankookensis]
MTARSSVRSRRTFATLAAVVASVAALAPVGAATAQPSPGSLRAGALLGARPLTTAAALPDAARTTRILYASDDAHGKPIVVSGTVAVPRSAPPRGGWPVISWAHGTTGYADPCAPSRDTSTGPEHGYLGPITSVLDTWIRRGYAVVQTDYEGLGTPGGHPYINGTSEANAVTDIVRAARALNPRIGRNWIAAGHSQGGHAALFAAQMSGARAPQLSLKGVVAIAPGGVGLSRTVDFVRSGMPGAEAAEAFLPLIVLGANAAEPSIRPDAIFSDQAGPLVQAARTGCLDQIRAVPPIPPTQVLRADADTAALTRYLDSQDPARTIPRVPVMIAQGTADTLVSETGTDQLVATLCGRGRPIDYHVYPGQDHRATVPASLSDTQAFVSSVLAGRPQANTCGT